MFVCILMHYLRDDAKCKYVALYIACYSDIYDCLQYENDNNDDDIKYPVLCSRS